MLSKIDIKIIKGLLRNFATKDDLKGFATKNDLKGLARQSDLIAVKQDVSVLKTDVSVLKTDVSGLKQDVSLIKTKLDDLTDFAKDSIVQLMEWTNDIHNSIVKEKLPERVSKLEHVIKSS